MIQVTVFASSGHYTGIRISGHAGYADQPLEGQNLVCAAASALTLNMANSVEHFTDDRFTADVEEESGTFSFSFMEKAGFGAQLLLDSLIFGLEDLAESYGEPYIRIRFQEV